VGVVTSFVTFPHKVHRRCILRLVGYYFIDS